MVWLLLLLSIIKHVFAQTSLTTSVMVGVAQLQFEGYTCSGCLVTFVENSSTIGSAYANSSGFFSKNFDSMLPGVHDVGIYATDPQGAVSDTITYSQAVTVGNILTLSNIILPPTISSSATSVEQGQSIVVSGYGPPGQTIALSVEGGGLSVTLTSDTSGYWTYTFSGISLAPGNYGFKAQAQYSGGYLSETTLPLSFTISTVSITPTPLPGPTATAAPVQTVTLNVGPLTLKVPLLSQVNKVLAPFFRLFALGNDGKYSSDQFVSVLKKWVDYWRKGEQTTCDLNIDKYCDIYDFSILLFHMT
jgi:hypothetical protein